MSEAVLSVDEVHEIYQKGIQAGLSHDKMSVETKDAIEKVKDSINERFGRFEQVLDSKLEEKLSNWLFWTIFGSTIGLIITVLGAGFILLLTRIDNVSTDVKNFIIQETHNEDSIKQLQQQEANVESTLKTWKIGQ